MQELMTPNETVLVLAYRERTPADRIYLEERVYQFTISKFLSLILLEEIKGWRSILLGCAKDITIRKSKSYWFMIIQEHW